MKVLLSAYACAPGLGSEPEVGLRALLAGLRKHEVWVLTQPHMVEALEPFLAQVPHGDRAHLVPVGPAAPVPRAGLGALLATNLSHDRWQRNAAAAARRLDAQVDVDVVHHVTLAAYWMRTGVAEVDKPLVWGPVGGAVEAPARLARELGLRGGVEDLARTVVRRVMAARPATRRTARHARVVLVQNDETRRRVTALGSTPRVLPNALCVTVDELPTVTRRREVVMVGRVVGWKAVPLAVRALSLVGDPDLPLRIYGDATGAERERVLAAARRWGMQDRVHLMGKLPRGPLMAEVAAAGVLLHTSLHEEAGVGIAEALTVGTPVVALGHGGAPAVTSAWPDAEVRLVRPGSPRTTATRLARAVEELLDPLRPAATALVRPEADFAGEVLAAYEAAVRPCPAARAGRPEAGT